MRKLILFILLICCVEAKADTNVVALMVNRTNGAPLTPTNFFLWNSNRIWGAISNFIGGGSATNATLLNGLAGNATLTYTNVSAGSNGIRAIVTNGSDIIISNAYDAAVNVHQLGDATNLFSRVGASGFSQRWFDGAGSIRGWFDTNGGFVLTSGSVFTNSGFSKFNGGAFFASTVGFDDTTTFDGDAIFNNGVNMGGVGGGNAGILMVHTDGTVDSGFYSTLPTNGLAGFLPAWSTNNPATFGGGGSLTLNTNGITAATGVTTINASNLSVIDIGGGIATLIGSLGFPLTDNGSANGYKIFDNNGSNYLFLNDSGHNIKLTSTNGSISLTAALDSGGIKIVDPSAANSPIQLLNPGSSGYNGPWINFPTNGGPAGIGTGGAGVNPWIATVAVDGQWFSDSLAGDIAYRNTTRRLLFGITSGNASLCVNTTGNILAGSTTEDGTDATIQTAAGTISIVGTGTITVSDSTTDVTGTDTIFTSEVRVGDTIYTDSFGDTAVVVSISDDGDLVVDAPFANPSTDTTYLIMRPRNGDISAAGSYWAGGVKGISTVITVSGTNFTFTGGILTGHTP